MFTQQVELCRRIVLEHYGPIVETVAALLIHEGRLPLGLILRKTKLTALNVRQSLAVLIQHGIATHAEAKEGARTSIFYAVNIKAILRLQRAGLYLALVEERMGKDGLAAFRTIMANGAMSIGSVRDILGIKKTSKSAAKLKFDNVVAKLVRERFITAVTPKDTVTKVDRVMQEETKMVDAMDIPPTAKQLMEIRRTIKERDDVEYFSSSVVGIKRAAPLDTYGDRPSKMHVQIGLDGLPMGIAGDTSTAGAEEDTVDDKQCFRAYYDRLDVLLRNQQIVNFFTEKYNVGAGAVVKAILRVSEPHTRTCREKISDVVSASQVIQNIAADAPLGDSVDTGSDMFYEKLGSANASSGKGPTSELSQTKRNEIAFALLEVLHADSSGIVVKVEERGAGQYRVNFERASATLRDQVLDDLVQEKFGALHARLIRVLRDKQKLDEKVVSQATMLPIAMCRERLNDLAVSNLIDTLEIPRSADRNPSRMFYLWFVNPDKQVRAAMRFIFQGMTNLSFRTEHELAIREPLITKTKRKDIIADPSLLTDYERKELAKLEDIKQKLKVAKLRLDSMLLIVHDINPKSADLQLLQ